MRYVKKLGAIFVSLLSLSTAYAQDKDAVDDGITMDSTILFDTSAGPVLIELFETDVPAHTQHLKNMVEAGFYNTTRFTYASQGYYVQLGDSQERQTALSDQQSNLLQTLTGLPWNEIEFLKDGEKRGWVVLTPLDETSGAGESALTFFTGENTGLKGNETVLGRVIMGWETLSRIESYPQNKDNEILEETRVLHAQVLPHHLGLEWFKRLEQKSHSSRSEPFMMWVLVAIFGFSVATFFLSKRISPRTMISFALINALIAAFTFAILFAPNQQGKPMVGLLIFMSMVGLFKLMNRFESM